MHHPAPPPPLAWHYLNASVAAGSTPSAAFRAILGETVEIPSSLSRDGLLTPRDEGRRFVDEKLEQYMAALFVAAVIGRRWKGKGGCDDTTPHRPPPLRLHPTDLFHGHLIHTPSAGFALLLHACEYPAYCDDAFPYHLGRGQTHSTLAATPERLAWRNILASGGWLASVDVGPASPIHDALVWPDLAAVGTLCESDLGEWCGDVVYVCGHVWGFEGPRE